MTVMKPLRRENENSSGLHAYDTSVGAPAPLAADRAMSYVEIEDELKAFEIRERERLGLEEVVIDHWFDPNPQQFTQAQREHTTLLFGGLTIAQDYLVGGALKGIGYNVVALDVPDNEALRFGKEFGNRGQCNPTYFTVGNLVKHLVHLRDEMELSTEEMTSVVLPARILLFRSIGRAIRSGSPSWSARELL